MPEKVSVRSVFSIDFFIISYYNERQEFSFKTVGSCRKAINLVIATFFAGAVIFFMDIMIRIF